MIKNIVFDAGGVLVYWKPKVIFRRFFNNETEVDAFLKEIDFDSVNARADRGENLSDMMNALGARFPQYAAALSAYDKEWITCITGEVPGTRQLALDLRLKGYKIFILSNWEIDRFYIMRKKYDILDIFDGCLVSGDVGEIKPEPKIYEIFLSKFSLTASECVFLDDREDNVEGGRRAGMTALLFTTADAARENLRELVVEQNQKTILF